MSRNRKKISRAISLSGETLRSVLEEMSDGLLYMSETDAPIGPVLDGRAKEVSSQIVLERFADDTEDRPVREIDFEIFFERLTSRRDWHGPDEIKNAERFSRLRNTLLENLTDIHVYRVGRVQVDIYVVGLDREGNIAGIKTRAVET
jgi:hypothetical protein